MASDVAVRPKGATPTRLIQRRVKRPLTRRGEVTEIAGHIAQPVDDEHWPNALVVANPERQEAYVLYGFRGEFEKAAALVGAPISDEFVDEGSGRHVQRFERGDMTW